MATSSPNVTTVLSSGWYGMAASILPEVCLVISTIRNRTDNTKQTLQIKTILEKKRISIENGIKN